MLLKRIFNWSQLISAVLIFTSAAFAAGEVDPTFNAAVQETTQGSVQTIVAQPDGKFLVGGNFTVAGNSARSSIARFNADGTIDPTFDPPEFYSYEQQFPLNERYARIHAIAVQPDGKILVGGVFVIVNGQGYNGIIRLNADGTIDTSFYVQTTNAGGFSPVYDIEILANNQIMIGGFFSVLSQQPGVPNRNGLARLNADGSPDLSFSQIPGSVVQSFAVQPDGKIIYADGTVRRVNSDGSIDSSFTQAVVSGGSSGPSISKVVLQPDGKIIVGGSFTAVNGFPQNNITRLTTSGALDVNFSGSGTGASDRVNDVAVAVDGKIIIGGQFGSFNNVGRQRNARLNADGTLDTAFNYSPGTGAVVNAVAISSDGRIIVGGSDSSGNWNKLARLNADGSSDAAFVGAVYQKGIVFKAVAQPDGKVLLAGVFRKVNGIAREGFARLNADGSLDPTFVANTGGTTGGTTVASQPDGKVIVAGAFGTINGVSRSYIARFNANGSLDTGFGVSFNPSVIDEVVPLADGKILIAGTIRLSDNQLRGVVRLNNNGSIDTSFSVVTATQANFNTPAVRTLEVQADGKIVIGGNFTQISGVARGRIARLNADGSLDATFNPPFGANADIVDLAVQSNGSVVIGGDFTGINGNASVKYLARLLPDGNLDASFVATAAYPVNAVERQTDDKILYGGLFSIVNSVRRFGAARLNANGAPDNSFAAATLNDVLWNIFIQSDNKILLGGEFTRVNRISRVNVARLNNAAAAARTPFDYDGDGRADVSIFRPSNGVWYILPSLTNGFYGFPFGQAGDLIAPADYDGDGKTDVAVFRPVVPGAGDQAYFYTLNSADNSFRAVGFGTQGDVPVSGDWDGDGKADLAVYREASAAGGQSNFFYRPSSQATVNFNTISLGTRGDKPVVGDYDGDGKIDAAVFRASTATWIVLQSSNSVTTQTAFGLSTDIPTPADYDGDGRTNIAVFRPSNGTWFTSQNPATNFGAIQFGANGDLPVAADYDGDGRADTAVFRPSNGAWFLNRTTSGLAGVQFGANGDKPSPNAYIR